MEMVGVVYDHITGVCSTAPVSVARLSLPLWCRDRCRLGKSWKASVAYLGDVLPQKNTYSPLTTIMAENVIFLFIPIRNIRILLKLFFLEIWILILIVNIIWLLAVMMELWNFGMYAIQFLPFWRVQIILIGKVNYKYIARPLKL